MTSCPESVFRQALSGTHVVENGFRQTLPENAFQKHFRRTCSGLRKTCYKQSVSGIFPGKRILVMFHTALRSKTLIFL